MNVNSYQKIRNEIFGRKIFIVMQYLSFLFLAHITVNSWNFIFTKFLLWLSFKVPNKEISFQNFLMVSQFLRNCLRIESNKWFLSILAESELWNFSQVKCFCDDFNTFLINYQQLFYTLASWFLMHLFFSFYLQLQKIILKSKK